MAAGARVHFVFVELEIERERVAAAGVFDERRVVEIPTGDAAGVVGEHLVEVDFGNDPVGGGLFEGEGELRALFAIAGFDVREIAGGVVALEHGAQRLAFAEPVFAFFKQDAKASDLGVRDGRGVHEGPRALEILLQDGLQESVGHGQ